ncbi:MAG: Rrf2 family transcriptional regulator [Clostridia bacterium]|nr:Rrf2 family transcriptional regulator [Clostridia bacterium]
MLISTKGRYALRVLVDMAEHQSEGFLPLREIAERQDVSEKYLESIVRELVKEGAVVGVRGKGGGYRLNRAPEKIGVGDILCRMEGSLAPVACLEKDAAPCGRAAQCRTLAFWRGLDEAIRRYTAAYTIADLMRKAEDGNDYVI